MENDNSFHIDFLFLTSEIYSEMLSYDYEICWLTDLLFEASNSTCSSDLRYQLELLNYITIPDYWLWTIVLL